MSPVPKLSTVQSPARVKMRPREGSVNGFVHRASPLGSWVKSNKGTKSTTKPQIFTVNWLQVLGTTEPAQIDHRIPQQLHPIVSLLDAFKAEQQPFELVFPREGPLDSHA